MVRGRIQLLSGGLGYRVDGAWEAGMRRLGARVLR